MAKRGRPVTAGATRAVRVEEKVDEVITEIARIQETSKSAVMLQLIKTEAVEAMLNQARLEAIDRMTKEVERLKEVADAT